MERSVSGGGRKEPAEYDVVRITQPRAEDHDQPSAGSQKGTQCHRKQWEKENAAIRDALYFIAGRTAFSNAIGELQELAAQLFRALGGFSLFFYFLSQFLCMLYGLYPRHFQ